MPLQWKRGENPYRLNYFGILGIGATATHGQIAAKAKDVMRKSRHGTPPVIDGREVSEAEINEAEARLLDEGHWAEELLLVHPSASESSRLPRLCSEIAHAATPGAGLRTPVLANLGALVPFVPAPCAEDIPWPKWDDLGVPNCHSPQDRECDIQFDL